MAGVLVSYDGTVNDDDALALGRMLAGAGGTLALAYVRHAHEYDPRREELAAHDAQRRLQAGAVWLEDPEVARHVVFDASTGAGLARLAAAEGAAVVVFGSDYRTSPGRVEPGTAAQQMLEGGSVPVAVAMAGLRASGQRSLTTISVVGDGDDDTPRQTAQALAQRLGATLAGPDRGESHLIVVGSQAGAPEGRIALGGATRGRLDLARSSVLVLPRGAAIWP